MITIFHGDNYVASRNFLNQVKNATKLDAKSIKLEDLTQALEGNNLFGDQKPVIIENLLTLPRSKTKQILIDIVINSHDKDVYLWDKKAITAAIKKQFKAAKIQEFKLTKFIFKFLDSIRPNNQKQILSFLHQSTDTDPAELVFYLLHRRISQLIVALDSPSDLKGAPWQIGKLKSQTKGFTLNQLVKFHQKLIDLDFSIKTGRAVIPLASQLDLLFLNI